MSDRTAPALPLNREPLTFEEIYRAHFEFVWRTLQRMGVSDRDVQDACQKVFLVAYQRLAEFEGRSTLKTWLCGIALRVASDYRRSASHRHELLGDEAHLDVATEASQLAQLEQRERLCELDCVLAALSEEQRTVLVLFELEGMSGEDIAATIGVPEGTVRSRLRLARQAFSRIAANRRAATDVHAAGALP
ncbi:MAG TPA: sigma-70 family RNA polymerase sigma factor [Polyangiaceae bacterium]